ncbi:MAG: replicative DNA helicase [Sedimentisphaerales bacterium]|nr:replicative DNA helicase [Sedimentisphaerales bacterium]
MCADEYTRTVGQGASAVAASVRASVGRSEGMPQSPAAEAAILGSMMIDPRCISEVIENLDAEAFYRLENRHIFSSLISLYEKNRGEGIDAVLLRDELEKRNQLEGVGGVRYIGEILESVPSAASAMYYVGIVKEKLLLRQIITVAGEILDDAYDGLGEAREKLDEAERKIFTITNRKISSTAAGLSDLVVQGFELIQNRDARHVTGLSTGYHELDEKTCGLQNGEMIIVAGRPSMGKTSLALNIAENTAVTEKTPVALFSLEMGRQQLAERFLCSAAEIDTQSVRRGLLKKEQYHELARACETLKDVPVYIDDTAPLTPLELRGKTRRLVSQYGIKCVMVDYLQLMHLGTTRIESRQQEIATISRYIKALARELNIPIVVLSQLNRSPEGREGNRPKMSDLRESGSIEQDADVVMLLHREDYYKKQKDPNYQKDNMAEVIIAKQRNGPTGTIKLVFREMFTRFENAAAGVPEQEIPF